MDTRCISRQKQSSHDPGYDFFGRFPAEILCRIFGLVPCSHIRGLLRQVCRRWNEVINGTVAFQKSRPCRRPFLACFGRTGNWTLIQSAYDRTGKTWKNRAAVTAGVAATGNIKFLHCMNILGMLEVSAGVCTEIARCGKLDSLQFLCSIVPVEWDELTCKAAAAGGHIRVLQYLHDNGCGWDEQTCNAAAINGRIACLRYAHEKKCRWNSLTCQSAAKGGYIDCLQYLRENGCRWTKGTCTAAAANGQIACLQYAHDNKCAWDSRTCTTAAFKGELPCLTYAHKNGCKWTAWTCRAAVRGDKFDCLVYAHENGCDWDWQVCFDAAKSERVRCYLLEHRDD